MLYFSGVQAVCLTLRQFDGTAGCGLVRAAGGWRLASLPFHIFTTSPSTPHTAAGAHFCFCCCLPAGDLYDIIDWQQPEQRPSWLQGTAQ